jgi:hypothetical protein
MKKRLVYLKVILALLIVSLAYGIVNIKYEEPEAYKDIFLNNEVLINEAKHVPEREYNHLGKTPIFDAIIKKPTPTPTATPPPPVPYRIEDITRNWVLSGFAEDQAFFINRGTKKEWGIKSGCDFELMFRKKKCSIRVEKINSDDFTVLLEYNGQHRLMEMF